MNPDYDAEQAHANHRPDIRLGDLVEQIDQAIPFALAESWDKVGLLLGDPDALVTGVVVTLDVTDRTIELCEVNQANLIVVHHPLIFSPLSTLRADIAEQSLIRTLIQKDIAVLALHTNLDAAAGGTADCLADALDLPEQNRSVFFPVMVENALAAQPLSSDLTETGHGRVLDLLEPLDSRELKERVRTSLESSGVRQNSDAIALLHRLAVFPGSFDESWVERLLDLEVDAIVTGEIKHHVGLKLALRGIVALDAGHDVSERVVLPNLSHRLSQLAPELAFAVDYGFDYNKVTF
ncbi:MAG: Nif3-like dinuclear metal center hexameric protein [Clostridia bacterium]|nr:Nif3-like dinuclear metal center hexameric protein [Clostridia bacterium]